MRKHYTFCSLLFCLACTGVNAAYASPVSFSTERTDIVQQDTPCTGTVKDKSGETIIGASVVVKGTTIGSITNLDGKFTIKGVKKGSIIAISFIGYNTKEVVWNGTPINVTLEDNTQALNEVVVVGYGTQKKANLTGAVATVKMDDVLGDRPLAKASDALQGVVPGLMVSSTGNAPGQGKSFQLRGATTIGGGKSHAIAPLVLIDNVEGDIDLLNPDDIESVTVLKDAASSAIYGARAAGGVILVTTKHPKKGAKFTANYSNNFAFANAINLPKQAPLMNYLKTYKNLGFDKYWSIGAPSITKWMEYLTQYQKDPKSLDIKGDGLYKDESGAIYFLSDKDLFKDMLETSFQQTHNISMSGASDRLRYRLSAGLVDNNGVLVTDKDKFKRMNISSFLSADLTKWFTQEATLSYAHSEKNMPRSGESTGFYSTRLISYYPLGTMPEGMNLPEDDNLPFFTPGNQIRWSNVDKRITDNPRIFLKSILKPLKGLTINFEYTFDKNLWDYSWYTGKVANTTIQGGRQYAAEDDHLDKSRAYTDYNAINLYGTYQFDFLKDHHVKVMAGYNQESSDYSLLSASSHLQAYPEVPALSSGTGTISANDDYNEFAVRSGFFRVNYNFKDKYLLEVNGRYDGSSKFPKDSRFGFFPSISAGWNITQEKFMKGTQSWLNLLKIRGSYGKIGNQNIASYMFLPTMNVSNKYSAWLVDGQYVTAVTDLPSLVSTNFTWEKVSTINLGLDVTMFNGKFTGLLEWYQRNTNGMLAPGMELPAVVGAPAPMQNTANMRTRGWELSMNWRDKIGKLGYNIGFNISNAENEIVKYDNNNTYALNTFYKGQKLGEIWGYVNDGFYTMDDFVDNKTWVLKDGVTSINGAQVRPGDVKFKNLRDDDKLGENVIYGGNNTLANPGDRKIIGNSTPRYLYGINLGASYCGFDLNIFMQGVGKRDAWLANPIIFPLYSDFKFTPLYDGLENYWQPVDAANGDYTAAKPDAYYPRIYDNYGNLSSNYRVQDKYLSDASYLRIKNISLSYSFPKAWVQKISLSKLKAFVNVENAFTFTSLKKGIDPETLNWAYPAFRTVSFGINVSL